jgi:predicted DNA-binding protein
MPDKDTVQFTVRLPQDLHRALSHIAVDEGRKLSEIIRELVEKYVEQRPAS